MLDMANSHEMAIPAREQGYLEAARVPRTLQPQKFGLWTIVRERPRTLVDLLKVGWSEYTILRRLTLAGLHLEEFGGEVVMEDSRTELARHLPIFRQASGRVLISGLGLGCVVRGLLFKPEVRHIDVVEIDRDILRIVGAEFAQDDRVTLHQGDALSFEFPAGTTWDFAWHDLHQIDDNDTTGLQTLHEKLLARYIDQVDRQGAWNFPRDIWRRIKRSRQGHRFL